MINRFLYDYNISGFKIKPGLIIKVYSIYLNLDLKLELIFVSSAE